MTPLQPPATAALERRITSASYVLMGAGLLLVMWRGLLPGLISVCLGFLLTRWLSPKLQPWLGPSRPRLAQNLAALLIAAIPLLLIGVALSRSRSYVLEAPQQYRELLDFMARTVLELRQKLPPDIAVQLPEGAAQIQRMLAGYLGTQAGTLTHMGRTWLGGLLHAYVGLLIGALAAVRELGPHPAPWPRRYASASLLLGNRFARSWPRSSGSPPSTPC